jgi:hypothetical protein
MLDDPRVLRYRVVQHAPEPGLIVPDPGPASHGARPPGRTSASRPDVVPGRSRLAIALAAIAVALGHGTHVAAAATARASGTDQPAGKSCVSAEEAAAHPAADGDDGNDDEGAPPKFSSAFATHTFTLDASLDGADGNQLPISIEEVCDVPKALAKQAAQLAGADGVALLSTRTSVWLDKQLLQTDAAASALDGADTAMLRVRLAPQRRWSEDEDGDKVATFMARRITITD